MKKQNCVVCTGNEMVCTGQHEIGGRGNAGCSPAIAA